MGRTPIGSFSESIYVTRATSAETLSMGRPVAGSTKQVTVKGSVQRMRPEEMQMLPEGYRSRKSYRIYSESALRALDETTGFAADKVTIDDEAYVIISVEEWRYVMGHYKAIAVRDERNAE